MIASASIPALLVTRSSQIHGIAFEGDAMFLRFRGGRTYRYTGPKVRAHYDALLAAESMGRYFGANVRHDKETTCDFVGVVADPVLDAPAPAERHENGDGV